MTLRRSGERTGNGERASKPSPHLDYSPRSLGYYPCHTEPGFVDPDARDIVQESPRNSFSSPREPSLSPPPLSLPPYPLGTLLLANRFDVSTPTFEGRTSVYNSSFCFAFILYIIVYYIYIDNVLDLSSDGFFFYRCARVSRLNEERGG